MGACSGPHSKVYARKPEVHGFVHFVFVVCCFMHVSQIHTADTVSGIVFQERAHFSLLLCPDCIDRSPMLLGTGELVPLGAVKLITGSVHSYASTLIYDYL